MGLERELCRRKVFFRQGLSPALAKQHSMKEIINYNRGRLAKVTEATLNNWFKMIQEPETESVEIVAMATLLHDLHGSRMMPLCATDLYRARPWRSVVELPAHVRDLLHPPPEQTSIGRCNLPGRPVLYVTDHPIAALREVGITTEGRAVVLRLRRRRQAQDTMCSIFGATDIEFPLEEDNLRTQALKNQVRELYGRQYIKWELVNRFLAQAFLLYGKGERPAYRFTAALCDTVFSQHDELDGIAYPSLQGAEGMGCTAFRIDRWAKAYEPFEAAFVERFADGGIRQVQNATVMPDGSLDWTSKSEMPGPWPGEVGKLVTQLRELGIPEPRHLRSNPNPGPPTPAF